MDSKIKKLLIDFQMNLPGVSDEMIRLTEEELGFKFPQDYLAFMKESNGEI